MQRPLISIVVAVHNGAETVQRCIDSVSAQNYPNKELVIADGGSTDGTAAILESNKRNIACWETETDRGIYHAWNKALKHVKGEWICFLGADDYFANDQVLEKTSEYIAKAAKIGVLIVYGQVLLVSGEGKPIERRGMPWEYIKKPFRTRKMTIANPGCFYHRKMFSIYGKFDESFSVGGDYEMLLRELKNKDALYMPTNIVSVMATGGISNAPASQFLILNEEILARKLHGLHRLDAWLICQYLALILAKSVSSVAGEKWARLLLDGYRFCVGKSRRWTI